MTLYQGAIAGHEKDITGIFASMSDIIGNELNTHQVLFYTLGKDSEVKANLVVYTE